MLFACRFKSVFRYFFFMLSFPFSVVVKFHSHHPLSHLLFPSLPVRLAFFSHLSLSSFVHLPVLCSHFFTLLSGPHVHKKSRQQFLILVHRFFFVVRIPSLLSFKNFLLFKLLLSRFLFLFDFFFFFSFSDSVSLRSL